jgi:hypothetical protein
MRVRRHYLAVTATTSTVWMLLALLLTTSALGKPCLTKDAARQLYKTDRIYWHTAAHCWDDQASASKSGYEANVAATSANPPVAATVKPQIEIAFPSLVKADGISSAQWTSSLHVNWFSPWPMLTHPWIWDFDAPDAFTPWRKRIE